MKFKILKKAIYLKYHIETIKHFIYNKKTQTFQLVSRALISEMECNEKKKKLQKLQTPDSKLFG